MILARCGLSGNSNARVWESWVLWLEQQRQELVELFRAFASSSGIGESCRNVLCFWPGVCGSGSFSSSNARGHRGTPLGTDAPRATGHIPQKQQALEKVNKSQ